jgi:hypothetical protein
MDKEKLTSEILDALMKARDTASFSIDSYLDCRDDFQFDQDWSLAYADVEKKKSELPKKTINLINGDSEAFREIVFKQVFKVTQSHDLAAYISDDAGLILENHLVGGNNQWVARLENCYSSQLLPSGTL